MANARRGEIEATLDGRRWRLCLTLGALAELEHAFGAEDMLALALRFERGRISSRDAVRIIAAGLRGAGAEVTEDDVARMQADGGVGGFIDIVARLLAVTFAGDERAATVSVSPTDRKPGEAGPTGPFPGTT